MAGFAVPFALVLYLALESGGYDLLTRSQVGIVAWWGILLGVTIGMLPIVRLTRAGWIAIALLGLFTLWTALALLWTQSQERTVVEISRVLTLLGFLILLLLLQGKDGLRRSVSAVGVAVVFVTVVALVSRYQPGWFDLGEFPESYPKARLNFPIGYWNGLAALVAMGTVSMMWVLAHGRTVIGRSLSAGSISLLALTIYMTASRGGLAELAAALIVLFVFSPGRLQLVVSLIVPALGIATLLAMLEARPELRDNLVGSIGSQGTEMMILTAVVFAAVAALHYLCETRLFKRVSLPQLSRQTTQRIGLGVAAALAIVVVGAVASGFVGDRLDEFKRPVGPESATVERLGSFNSGERYDQWVSAIEAGKTEPLSGIGPGAYEYWWSREGDGQGFVRDAHSFYLEGFAELGIVGLALTLALVLVPILTALRRAARPARDDRRPLFAAVAAGMTAFAVAAGIDWAWETTVLPAAFLVFWSAVAGPDAETRKGTRHARTFRFPLSFSQRVWIGSVSVVAVVVIAVPMLGTLMVRGSQSLYRQGDLNGALDKAERAQSIMPWSGTADVQVALLQLEAGNQEAALKAATEATEDDPYSWRFWLVLANVAERDGDDELAASAMERVAELNRRYAAD